MGVAHKVLRLYTTSDKFYVQPLGEHAAEDTKILEIDRVSQELNLNENKGQIPPRSAEVKEIYGVLGILHLLAGPYLVVITKRKLVGLLFGEEIWEMVAAEIIPFPKGTMHLTETQVNDNKAFLQMAQNTLHTKGFYFSYAHDLTHSAQRLQNTDPDFHQLPLYERSDQRFIWNHNLLRMFVVQPELYPFVVPLMHGCTRFNIRGLDEEGEVANFVETEQFINYNGSIASYVQTRGSIPLFWSQYPTIKYKPKPAIDTSKNHTAGFRRHIDNQLAYYGPQVLVNLIDQKGGEKILGDQFESAAKSSGYLDSQLKYIAFDFHKECSKMRWHRLDILMNMLKPSIDEMSYFLTNRDKEASELQNGVVRTNCMDCLDRTNVVQSLIARYVLQKQLVQLGIIGADNQIVEFDDFEYTFKNVWADNADMCSLQYSGTGALKTDFTRTGKRSKYGLLQDGVNSMIRYYKNNFSDGFRQDGIDLILGNFVIDPSYKASVLSRSKGWKYMALPSILLFGFSMFIISLIIPATDFHLQLTYVAFWAAACLVTLYLVMLFGTEFVDKPKLANKRPTKEVQT